MDDIEAYLKQCKRHRRLSKEEETQLARIIQVGKAASKELAAGHSSPELVHLVREGTIAKERFTLSNLLLVVTIASRYKRDFLTLPDIIQEGNIGLMRAVEKFDPDRGVRFSVYASWWIKQAINRARNKSGQIVIPCWIVPSIQAVEKISNQTDEEIAAKLKIDQNEVQKLRDIPKVVTSIHHPLGEDGLTLEDILPGNDDIDLRLDAERRKLIFFRAIEQLTPLEKQIFEMMYGPHSTDATYAEIGHCFGVEGDKIRMILNYMKKKIKKWVAEKKDKKQNTSPLN